MVTDFDKILAQIQDQQDLAYLTARFILRETVSANREMALDKGNDSETRGECFASLLDADRLVESARDTTYAMMVDDFFDQVAEQMVKLAPDYVLTDPLKSTR